MDRAAAEVLALDPAEFWFIAVLIAAAAAGALFFGFRALHCARVIADIPTCGPTMPQSSAETRGPTRNPTQARASTVGSCRS